ncbi:uncharacterized protein LOC131288982 [Anopheles ziemanni]|uniref:uncharacterized protein LOC131259683 n=1 Tax=Anopheles coustani TaxID=139045 RepID=UPI0026584E0D|nr:uncharacterized protein LOC131259683 [Anopheles coustani]XP_058174150.1 uncharacterized protein LOC131288982 [Anopheles ziemanni]
MIPDVHKPDQAQWDQLDQMVKETRNFLTEYDEIVLHKELYRTLFVYHLTNLRDEVIMLLKKFTTLPTDIKEEKEIECCGLMYNDKDAFKKHYEDVHNKKVLQSASLCELKMSLTKISFFERHIKDYLAGGEESSCELLLNLRRILRRLDHTLEF